jgi:hypothetical protein
LEPHTPRHLAQLLLLVHTLCLALTLSRQAAPSDRAAKARLTGLEAELNKLKDEQKTISDRWRLEKDDMNKLQYYKEEIDRVNLEIQQAERDYDLNR